MATATFDWLKPISGSTKDDRLELRFPKLQFSLGRKNTDFEFDAPDISSNHALLVFEDDYWNIQDTKSTHGTKVNGHSIGQAPVRLYNLDRIELADAVMLEYRSRDPNRSHPSPNPVPPATSNLVEIDPLSQEVLVNGVTLDPPLSSKGFDLLKKLWDERPAPVKTEVLIRVLWPVADWNYDSTHLKKEVNKARNELKKQDERAVSCIRTRHGVGYQWQVIPLD